MELTNHELNFICCILDRHQLPGFSLFSVLSTQQAKEVQSSLVKKDILTDDQQFTKKGLRLLEILSLYINAQKFYKFGKNGIFAQYYDKEFVFIYENQNHFGIELVSQDEIVTTLLMQIPDLKSVKDGKYRKKLILEKQLYQLLKENSDIKSLFYYKSDLENKSEAKAVMFVKDNSFHHYDAITGVMEMYPRDQIQQGIEKIFI